MSRRESRRDRPRRVKAVVSSSRLHLVVATQPRPVPGGVVDLSHEVALVKAALLYADTVELVSPGAQLMEGTRAMGGASVDDTLQLLASLDPSTLRHLGGKDLPPNWLTIIQGARLLATLAPAQRRELAGGADPEAIDELVAMVRGFEGPAGQLRDIAHGLIDGSGLRDLDEPVKLGLVRLTGVGLESADTTEIVNHVVERIREVLQDPAAHALFDEATASLARSLVEEGWIEPDSLSLVHARQAAVSGGLIARLPSFPDSPMHDVLGLRADLAAPLARYRRGISDLASKLQAQVYDEQSAAEIDDLWRNQVSPTLQDLREGLAEHSFVRSLARQAASDPKAVAAGVASAGALVMGFQSGETLQTMIAMLAGGAGAVGSTAALAGRAANDGISGRRAARKHDLFYLHEVDSRLS